MRIAEEFVRANGYTDNPPAKRVSALNPESFERTPPETWPAYRKGLLGGRAWGYQHEARSGHSEGWLILFRIKRKPPYKLKESEAAYGKVVQMDGRGKNLVVLHGVIVAYDKPDFVGYTKRTD